MGVADSTFRLWVKKYSAISAAYKKGKAPADYEVENALYKRAMGYEYTETVEEIIKGADGEERRHVKRFKKHMPSDPASMFFWLKNRRPDRWRERQNSEQTQAQADDGFLQALSDTAKEDWNEGGGV